MATSIKLKSDIKKIEAAIKSKATPKSLVPKLQAQLEKIKDELASLNSPKPKKGVTKTKVLSSLQKLKAKVKSTKSLAGYKKSGIDLKKDADVPALPLGKRYSQTTGNPYYEYRLNRADVKQPPKRYPKLEDGGEVDRYSVVGIKNGEKQIINNKWLTKKQAEQLIKDAERSKLYSKVMLSQSEPPEYASGGRLKSAVNRDRAYKSDEAWEQSYKRKSRPKNPKYDTSDKGIFEKGGYMAMGGALEHGLMVGDVVKRINGNVIDVYNEKTNDESVLDISNGKRVVRFPSRVNVQQYEFAQGGELHRLEQGM